MIAVDTNILVRYAVKDDKRQTALATSFIADNECYVLKSEGFRNLGWKNESEGIADSTYAEYSTGEMRRLL
jgi:hypothetical protein